MTSLSIIPIKIQICLAIFFMTLLLPFKGQTQTKYISDGFKPAETNRLPVIPSPLPALSVDNKIPVQQHSTLSAIQSDLTETEDSGKEADWMKNSKHYRHAFEQLSGLNPDSFSLAMAVYLVENAYMDGRMSYAAFKAAIAQRAEHARQIIKRQGLNIKNNTALNYGIQQLYAQQNSYYNPDTKKSTLVKPFSYRFDDYEGEKDHTNMFVAKLLATSKGQCHSMPLLYLLIAEQLGAKAFLSLAPQHYFIKFQDEQGNLYNYETTNGNIVSGTWITQSGYITAKALQNHLYFDTLSTRNLYAQMLNDLLSGYLKKFNYDHFAEQIRQKVLQANPRDIAALIVEANIATHIASSKIKSVGYPKETDLPNYPEAYDAYLNVHRLYEQIDATGYQDMPPQAYQQWLKSIEQEKTKQATLEAKQRMEWEINELKKSTIKPHKTN